MIIDVYGKARIQHAETGIIYEIGSDLLNFEFEYSETAKMGIRAMYSAEIQHPQLGKLMWEVWEYPFGAQEDTPTYHFGSHKLLEDFKFDCTAEIYEEDVHEKAEMLVAWFHENYEDPAHRVSYESSEGGYQWNFGGPCDAGSELRRRFPHERGDIIEIAVEQIEADGILEWSPIPNSPDSVVEDLFLNHDLKDISNKLNTLIDSAPKAKTDPTFAFDNDNRLHIIPPPDNQPIDSQDDLLDELRTIASTLLESFKKTNIHPKFLPIVELYNEALSSEQISISRLYARGIRLDNLAQETSRDTVELSLSAHIKSELNSTLELHGSYIMSNEQGRALVQAATAYRQTPEQITALKEATKKLAHHIRDNDELFSENTREHVPVILEDAKKGKHLERLIQIIGTTLTNMVSSLLKAIKGPGAIPISAIMGGGVATSNPGIAGITAVKDAINAAWIFLTTKATLIKTIATSSAGDLSWLAAVADILVRISTMTPGF